jgi:putative oxidoreductase
MTTPMESVPGSAMHVEARDERTPRGSGSVHTSEPALGVLGRVLYATPFAVFGIMHFANAERMAQFVPLPAGTFWVYLTGAAMLCAAVAMITGVMARWAAYGLALLLLAFVLLVHLPGLYFPQLRQMALQGLLKDTSLLGAALGWGAYFAEHPRGPKAEHWAPYRTRADALR